MGAPRGVVILISGHDSPASFAPQCWKADAAPSSIEEWGSLLKQVLRWREDLQFREVRQEPRRVSREQSKMFNRGMRANVEIRHGGVPRASAFAIGQET